MLLVVFGAGASFDSAPTFRPFTMREEEKRPPLASQLFAQRPRYDSALENFSQCQSLVPYLRHSQDGRSVEQLLQQYLEEGKNDPVRQQQLAAIRFYLRSILGENLAREWGGVHRGVTNYKTFLDDLRHWRLTSGEKVCLVTFNYDTMLEDACQVVGLHITHISDYIGNENYKLIKPHGSVHWVRELQYSKGALDGGPRDVIARMIDGAASLQFKHSFHILSGDFACELPREFNRRRAAFPAIAIPVVSKDSFECPLEHIEALQEALPQVTRIITIGWRAKEEHFLKLLRKSPGLSPRIMVVASNQSEAMLISQELREGGIGSDFYYGIGGFTDAVLKQEFTQFLQRQ